MHPAGILHFASPDFIAVLVIMRKNYKKDSSESVLPGHVRFGQAKKRQVKFSCHPCARCTRLRFHSQGCHKSLRHTIYWLEVSKDFQHVSARMIAQTLAVAMIITK